MKALAIGGFVVMVVLQWAVPVSMILENETTVSQGDEFHFKTQPVDPADPFRGRYVTLSFDGSVYWEMDTSKHYPNGGQVFALLGVDSAGFAEVRQLALEPFEGEKDYITVNVSYESQTDSATMVVLEFPFTRFYVEESKASEAEQLYWQNTRSDTTSVCYGVVKVKEGRATLTDVMIDGRSIIDIVEELNRNKD